MLYFKGQPALCKWEMYSRNKAACPEFLHNHRVAQSILFHFVLMWSVKMERQYNNKVQTQKKKTPLSQIVLDMVSSPLAFQDRVFL